MQSPALFFQGLNLNKNISAMSCLLLVICICVNYFPFTWKTAWKVLKCETSTCSFPSFVPKFYVLFSKNTFLPGRSQPMRPEMLRVWAARLFIKCGASAICSPHASLPCPSFPKLWLGLRREFQVFLPFFFSPRLSFDPFRLSEITWGLSNEAVYTLSRS